MPRLKKIGIVFLVLFLLFVLAIAALPVWLPWLLSPVMSRLGATYDSYERHGYGRFELVKVTYLKDDVRVRAESLEGFVPTAWLWSLWRGKDGVDYVAVENWHVSVERGQEAAEPSGKTERDEEVSVYGIVADIEKLLPRVNQWLPRATLGSGQVVIEERILDVRGVTWREGRLETEFLDRPTEQVVTMAGDLGEGFPLVFRGDVAPFPMSVEMTVSREDDQVLVRSEVLLAENLVAAGADFPRDGYLPEEAYVRSDRFRVPAEYLELSGYGDLEGSIAFEWREGEYSGELDARADPLEEWESRLPPMRAEASARGDLESFRIETLEVRSPWVVATLSDPVEMDYAGELLSEESLFELAADLGEQPFVAMDGMVRGEVRISPGGERFPIVDFRLAGVDLAGFEVALDRVEATGDLRWPELTLEEVVVEGAEGSGVELSGRVDLDAGVIDGGEIEGTIHPELVARWLPEGVGFSRLAVAGTFEGPVRDQDHRGRANIEGLKLPSSHPMDGEMEWEGRMGDLSVFSATLSSGAGHFAVAGATRLEEEKFRLNLSEVRLERDAELLLESSGESQLVVDWTGDLMNLSLDQLHWAGEGREIRAAAEVVWPERGIFSANLGGLSTDLLTDFVDLEAGYLTLVSANIEGSWAESPIDFTAAAEVRMDLGEDEVLFTADVRAAEEELRVERFRVTSDGETLVLAEGILPVAIWPSGEERIVIREAGAMAFRAETDPQARFWAQLAELAGVHLEDPRLRVEISGTPASPEGHVDASALLVSFRALEKEDRPIPQLENLRILANFGEESIEIEELSLEVEGQRVEAEATLPMDAGEWEAVVQEKRLPDWKRVSGRVRIPEARIAAFTRFAPTLFSPQGTFHADIKILPDGLLDGIVTVDDVATRPLMPLGTVREGTARVELRGRTAHIEELSGLIGGERLTVTGSVGLPFEQPLSFDLAMKGQNLPLTRSPGVVIRGDLDLAARSEDGETPLISGRVDLHDSFYLAHLRLMPGGGVATPERRPPFFSVDQEPFADWNLDVELRGPGFLNVSGPIFRGLISASFNLSGTLEEPVAIGAAIIDSGRVRFPFASMAIDQGEIALRREDPFQPRLFIIASGMAFGYELTMEITGTAETPVIEFIANPPLTSEEALLMVTTGELPREEIHFSAQQRASRFAIYFGQNLLYEITGDDSAGDRLTIRSGEHVSESGRETTTIEFRLTDDWSVLGEYDRFDEYNVGLKWNIYSR